MNAADLADLASPHEIAALADTDDHAPGNIINVVERSFHDPDHQIDPAIAVFFTTWVDDQREHQSRAAIMLDLLHRNHPMPTPDEIQAGTAVFPTWVEQWWALTLRLPWSGRLNRAIDEAVAYLAAGGVTGPVDEL